MGSLGLKILRSKAVFREIIINKLIPKRNFVEIYLISSYPKNVVLPEFLYPLAASCGF